MQNVEFNEIKNKKRENQRNQKLFLWKISKIDKPLKRVTNIKREKTQSRTRIKMDIIYSH